MSNKNGEVKVVAPPLSERMDVIERAQAAQLALLKELVANSGNAKAKPVAKGGAPTTFAGTHTLSLHKTGSRYWVYRTASKSPFGSVCFDKADGQEPPKTLTLTVSAK